MDIFDLSYPQFELFVLTFVRISSMLVLVPVFGSKNLPMQIKAGLSLMLSIIIFSILELEEIHFQNIFFFFAGVLREALIGIVIGYSSRLIFAGIQMAGHIMGFQMGFAIVNVFDPTTASQVSIISEMKYIFAVLVFLSINAHHWIIVGMVDSFKLIPLTEAVVGWSVLKTIIDLFGNMFSIAIKIGAPIIAAVLFINVSLGLIARTVPQMNVYIVGFPLQIGLGLMILGVSMPLFYHLLVTLFNEYGRNMMFLLKAMGT